MAQIKVMTFDNQKYYHEKLIAHIEGLDASVLAQAEAKVQELANGAVKANTDAIAAINDESTGILAKAKEYADGKDAAIKAAQDAADAAQSDVDDLKEYVGTIPETATATDVVGYVDEKTAAVSTDLSELTERVSTNETNIKANTDAIGILNSDATVAGSVAKQVADAVAGIVNGAPEAYNTLKEISDWIAAHPESVAALNSAIGENTTAINNLKTLVGTLPEGEVDVVSFVQKLVTAEENRAKGVEAELDGKITTAKTNAVTEAKEYADGLNTAMNTRVEGLEADTHTHANKELLDTYTQTEADLADAVAKKHAHENQTVLDGITAEKVSAWDAAESNANGYTDGKVAELNQRLETLESVEYVALTNEEIDSLFTPAAE